ncbi:MAG TPA: acyl-CoA desaturase [Polyangia bacterium]|nr:acyl-CoA desaturase [Polyangia bacterium]
MPALRSTAPSDIDTRFGTGSPPRRARLSDYFRPSTLVFWGFHLAALAGVILCGFSWGGLALAVGTYFVRMVLVTGGYHRYFSHRAFKTSRAFQFLLALGAQSSLQKGVLWWAANHRFHHKTSDTPLDPHSAKQRGFLWAHVGWITAEDYDGTNLDLVGDLAKYPELRLLNRPGIQMLPAVPLALVLLLAGGLPALVWGFLVSTVMLWHGSFAINSLSHLIGRRRYATGDDSRNNWALALLTTGEGWHNNHHHYQSSANQGFRWWEIDVTFYVLRLFERCGLVWDLRRPPAEVLRAPGEAPPSAARSQAA